MEVLVIARGTHHRATHPRGSILMLTVSDEEEDRENENPGENNNLVLLGVEIRARRGSLPPPPASPCCSPLLRAQISDPKTSLG